MPTAFPVRPSLDDQRPISRDVLKCRTFLRRNPRKAAAPAPRLRRPARGDHDRILAAAARVAGYAGAKRNPWLDRADLVQEAHVLNLEAARERGADLSPDRCVRRGNNAMNAAIRAARRQLPCRLEADLIVGSDGLTPLDRTAEDDALTYGRGPLEMRPALDRLMRELGRRDRVILTLRYGLDGRPALSLQAVGRALGCSDSAVSRAELRAIDRLRDLAAARIAGTADRGEED